MKETVLAQEIVRRLRLVLGTASGPVALHEPWFQGREQEYVAECITTGWVSSVGRFVDRFEQDLALCTGAGQAVALVNGTCALQLALQLVGVRRDDEVLLPSLAFVATANAVAHLGAVPHFVDAEDRTLGMSPDALEERLSAIAAGSRETCVNRETGRRIAAVLPVHICGHPAQIDRLLEVAQRYGLPVVEDAAESLGSTYKGRHTGLWGRLGVFSFNGNKTVTTGGGGAIVTNDLTLAQRAKHLSTTAKRPHPWAFYHDEAGYNYRMPNLNAALGCAQLESLPLILERKRRLAEAYEAALAGLDEVIFVKEPADSHSNYWLCTILLQSREVALLEAVLQATRQASWMTRPAWNLLHTLPMYRATPRGDLTRSEGMARGLVSLPSGPQIAVL
jgi:perosamine synthetase